MIDSKKSKKYLLLGDMLELGVFSKKLHESIAPIINKTDIYKVFVKGKRISSTFNRLSKYKKGRIFNRKSDITKFMRNELNNNDFLMIKASNATGFNKILNEFKSFN